MTNLDDFIHDDDDDDEAISDSDSDDNDDNNDPLIDELDKEIRKLSLV